MIKRIISKIKNILYSMKYRYFYNYKKCALYKHAKHELDILLATCKYDKMAYKIQKDLNNSCLDMVLAFCKYRHSGGSAQYQINNLNLLLNYKPILPLTGDNSEWNELDEDFKTIFDIHDKYRNKKNIIEKVYQNKRCGSVFMCKVIDKETGELIDEKSYDISKEHMEIEFPYKAS